MRNLLVASLLLAACSKDPLREEMYKMLGLRTISPTKVGAQLLMNALMEDPGEDQVTLAGKVAFDAATFGSVIGRLEAKGWVRRKPDGQRHLRDEVFSGWGAALVEERRRVD